ncbi:hypothetical protein MAN_05686, partial [Metarhizium hybridum]
MPHHSATGHVPAQQNPRSPRQAERLENVPILDSGIRVASIEKLTQTLTARQYGRNDALLEDPRLRQSKSAVFVHERVQLLPQDAEDPLVVGDEDAPHVVDAAQGNVPHHVRVQGEEFKIVQLASYLVHLFQDPSLNGNQLRRPLGHGRFGAPDAVEGKSRRFGTAGINTRLDGFTNLGLMPVRCSTRPNRGLSFGKSDVCPTK